MERSCEPNRALRASAAFLRRTQPAALPLDMKAVLRSLRGSVRVLSYSLFAERGGFSRPTLEEAAGADGATLARVGWTRTEGCLFPETKYLILLNDSPEIPRTRRRFTLAHELGHIACGHFEELFREPADPLERIRSFREDSRSEIREQEAHLFARNVLCPAARAVSALRLHGYAAGPEPGAAPVLRESAPMLERARSVPTPERVLMNLFDLSEASARLRVRTLEEDRETASRCLNPEDIAFLEAIPLLLTCLDCGHITLSPALYCHHCGGQAFGHVPEPEPPSAEPAPRPDGRFALCPGCGEAAFPAEAVFCPTCGHPLSNPCLGDTLPPAQRGWAPAEDLPHFCRASDRFCGVCGAGTRLALDPPLRQRAWAGAPVPEMERLIRRRPVYVRAPGDLYLRPPVCPACGSTRRGLRLCEDCGELLVNLCPQGHACAPGDRYCPACGAPTRFLTAGYLSDYPDDPVFRALFVPDPPQTEEADCR